MKNLTRILLSMALLSLNACSPLVYGKVETPSITDKESFTNIPGGVNLALTALFPLTTFNIGDIFGFDLSSSEMKDSSIKLNGATLTLKSVTAGPANVNQVTEATLSISTPGGLTPIAQYVSATAGGTPAGSLTDSGTTIHFVPSGDVELFTYLQNKTVQVAVSAKGVGPGSLGSTWNADLIFDFKVAAQYNAL